MSKKGLIRATRNNRVYAVPTNYVKDSKGNVIKTLYTICTPQKPGEAMTTDYLSKMFEKPEEYAQAFTQEYYKFIAKFKYGIDYVDFEYKGYLLFMPLSEGVFEVFRSINTATFRKHIAQHNCLILLENPYFEYISYVAAPHFYNHDFKFFLINERTIDDETKAGISFVSFWYNPTTNCFTPGLYNGNGHYFNLDKIHKTKYYKGNEMQKKDIKYYQTKLPGVMTRVINAFNKRNKGIYDKVRPQSYYY